MQLLLSSLGGMDGVEQGPGGGHGISSAGKTHGTHLGRQAVVAGRADVCLCQPKFDGFRPRLHVVVAIQFIPMGGLVVRGAASLARDFGRI